MEDNKILYFAAKPSEEAAEALIDKAGLWQRSIITTNYLKKVRNSWAAYHGIYFNNEGHSISFGGEQGELVNVAVNHYKNIAAHLLNMTVANRPSMEARAVNTDYKSLTQTILANGLLDYYMREKRLEKHLKLATEYAIVLGEGYIKMEWDATSGEVYDTDEDTGTKIYEGDIKYSTMTPMDVVRDISCETDDYDWILCRTFKNRYDLIAKYPELHDQLLAAPSKNEIDKLAFDQLFQEDNDQVAIWEFFHKKSPALPDGRHLVFVTADAILFDGAIPYRDIPVFRIAPSNILGTPLGSTVMFDILPIQDYINMLYSTIATNQNAFGVQMVAVPKGADITVTNLTNGLGVMEYNATMGKPEPMNLTQTPAEIFSMIDRLEKTVETLSGINSVARGNPEASLKSGAALALVQAQAVQFASGLQQSYVQLVEDVGSATIKLLQDFAQVPRVAAIAGKANRTYMKEFSGADLDKVNRIIVDIANPLSKSTAGRLEIANNLLQMGLVKNAEQYFTVLNTGKLDSMIEGQQAQLMLIRDENERMTEGQDIQAVVMDRHKMHIEEHMSVLSDSELRQDPELVAKVLGHINEHLDFLRNTDPGLLAMIGEQQLPPPPPPIGTTPPGMPPQEAQGGPESTAQVTTPLPVGSANMPNMPTMPTPPPPFEGMPTDPSNVPVP